MPLRECMRQHTNREYLTWMDWLEEQWEHPTRGDFYLMQIARQVACVLSKEPDRIKLQDFLLTFRRKDSQRLSGEARMSRSKAFWKIVTGLIGRRKPDGRG